MRLFSGHTVSQSFGYFIDLIDDNIGLFGDALGRHLAENDNERLSDEAFAACYVDGMNKLIDCLQEKVLKEFERCETYKNRYLDARQAPERCGFRFPNKEMTIGKVYLYYVWGKTKKKAPKSDCIRLEKHLMQRVGQQCLKYKIIE